MDAIFKIEDPDIFQLAIKEMFKQSYSINNAMIAKNLIEAAKEDLRLLLIKANFDINDVSKQILNSNWDQGRAEQLVSLLEESKTRLFHSVITHYNSSYGNTVIDCKWLIKLVLGTSESKGIRYPLMQLELSTVNCNGQQKLQLYELHKDVLLRIIKSLESCLEVGTP